MKNLVTTKTITKMTNNMEQLTLHDKATLSLCRYFAQDRDKLVFLLGEADTDACRATIQDMIKTLDNEKSA